MNPGSIVRAALLALLVAAPALVRADAMGDLLDAQSALLGSRFVSETVDGEGNRVEGRFDTMQRIHMTTPDAEIIMLPEGTWMKTGGSWMKSPIDMSGMMKQFLPQTVEDLRKGISNVRDEGTVEVAGQSLRAIAYDQQIKVMGMTIDSSQRVFVDGQGRVVRSESQSEVRGRKSNAVQTIRYDDSIRVHAPD